MRYLLFHADHIMYKTTKKALKRPPDPPGEFAAGPAVVAFITVEKGDDRSVVERAVDDILDYALRQVKEERIVLYPYAHLSSNLEKPPRAHKILTLLESMVRERFNGEVHRAPFGWYKEFEIHVKGHPLSELSRTIEPEPPILKCPEGREIWSVKEAVEAGCLPGGISLELPHTKLSEEKIKILGLECRGWEALHYALSIAKALEGRLNRPLTIVPLNDKAEKSLEAHLRILTASEPPGNSVELRIASCPLDGYIAYSGTFREIVELLGLEEKVVEHAVEGGTLYLASIGGKSVPLAFSTGTYTVAGSVRMLVEAKILVEALKAEEGETPYLPVWLHPYTATVIPARKEQEEYSKSIALQLAQRGARVVLLSFKAGGLGSRIRWSGKRWIPYVLVVGAREAATATVSVRRRWKPGEQEVLPLTDLILEVAGQLSSYNQTGRIDYLERL